MCLPAELCKMQRKKRETDGFSKSTWMTPPGLHPTSGFGARHGLPKFFGHKKRRIVQKRCGKLVDLEGFEPLTSRMRTERSPMRTLKKPPKDKIFLWENGKKYRRNAVFWTSIAFEKKLPFLLYFKKVTLHEHCVSDAN